MTAIGRPQQRQESRLTPALTWDFSGADGGTRTRDPHLGNGIPCLLMRPVRFRAVPFKLLVTTMRERSGRDRTGGERAESRQVVDFESAILTPHAI